MLRHVATCSIKGTPLVIHWLRCANKKGYRSAKIFILKGISCYRLTFLKNLGTLRHVQYKGQ